MVDLKTLFDKLDDMRDDLSQYNNFMMLGDYVQVLGDAVVAPVKNTWLVSYNVPSNSLGAYLVGYFISAEEANVFNIYFEGPGYGAKTIVIPVSGVFHETVFFKLPLTKYKINPNTTVRIFNSNDASAGKKYQAALFLVVVY